MNPSSLMLIGVCAILLTNQARADAETFPTRLADIGSRDPFILAENGTYYLYAQTGNRLEDRDPNLGVDVYRSRDLENWSLPSLAFRRPAGFWGGEQIWAPEVHKYRDCYYMFVTFKDLTGKRGGFRSTQILRAGSPEGPFEVFSDEATPPPRDRTLDGTPFVDDAGRSWMVYCHEWVQIVDGAIVAIQFTEDWSRPIGEPLKLFAATDAPWVRPFSSPQWMNGQPGYVTDGPAFYKARSGKLLMLWSSFGDNGYAVGIAESANGSLAGPWVQREKPLFKEDGGHCMLFRTFEGQLMLALHQPNIGRLERARLFEVTELEDGLELRLRDANTTP